MRTKWHHATNPNQGLNDLPGKIAEVRKAIANASVTLPPMGDTPEAPALLAPAQRVDQNNSQPITLTREVTSENKDTVSQEQLKRSVEREKMLLERINWLESSTRWLRDDKEAQYMDMILHDELRGH